MMLCGNHSWFTGRGDTAAKRSGDGDDSYNEDDGVTDNDMYNGQYVDCPITPAARCVKLLVKVREPNTEYPTVAAHEPRQQKPAQ